VVRAYIVAGSPDPRPRLASFEEWSNTVRSALVWLGRVDPMDTMATARTEDPKRQELSGVIEAWIKELNTGRGRAYTAAQLLAKAAERGQVSTDEWAHPLLREALEGVGSGSAKTLGKWLGQNKGRIVGKYRLTAQQKGQRALEWYVEEVA
jgi:hypothetical protein